MVKCDQCGKELYRNTHMIQKMVFGRRLLLCRECRQNIVEEKQKSPSSTKFVIQHNILHQYAMLHKTSCGHYKRQKYTLNTYWSEEFTREQL